MWRLTTSTLKVIQFRGGSGLMHVPVRVMAKSMFSSASPKTSLFPIKTINSVNDFSNSLDLLCSGHFDVSVEVPKLLTFVGDDKEKIDLIKQIYDISQKFIILLKSLPRSDEKSPLVEFIFKHKISIHCSPSDYNFNDNEENHNQLTKIVFDRYKELNTAFLDKSPGHRIGKVNSCINKMEFWCFGLAHFSAKEFTDKFPNFVKNVLLVSHKNLINYFKLDSHNYGYYSNNEHTPEAFEMFKEITPFVLHTMTPEEFVAFGHEITALKHLPIDGKIDILRAYYSNLETLHAWQRFDNLQWADKTLLFDNLGRHLAIAKQHRESDRIENCITKLLNEHLCKRPENIVLMGMTPILITELFDFEVPRRMKKEGTRKFKWFGSFYGSEKHNTVQRFLSNKDNKNLFQKLYANQPEKLAFFDNDDDDDDDDDEDDE